MAGIYLAARVSSGDPTMGASFSLESVTAVALGGVQLTGGVGSIVGVITGALSLGLITNGINLFGISPFMRGTVTGALAAGGRVPAAAQGGGPVTAAVQQSPPGARGRAQEVRAAPVAPAAGLRGHVGAAGAGGLAAPAIAVPAAAAADPAPGRAAGAGGDGPIAGHARAFDRPVGGRCRRGRVLHPDQRLPVVSTGAAMAACACCSAWWWARSTAC